MKSDEVKKWREAGVQEKRERIEQLTAELFSLRRQLRMGHVKNYSFVRSARRDIARLKTLVKEATGRSGDAHAKPSEAQG